MRLIDADKINFEEVFGGQSDFAKDIRESAQNLIDRQATAFDKEKVIEKLKDQYNYSRKVRDKNNNVYFEYWDGRTDSYKDAIEIVEKGGIE